MTVVGEVAYALALFLVGLGVLMPLARTVSWTGIGVMAYPVGLAAVVTVSWLGLVLRLPYDPLAAHGVAAVAALAVALLVARTGRGLGRAADAAAPLGAVAAAIAAVAATTAAITLVRVTTDSFRYLQVGSVLDLTGSFAAVVPFHLLTRPPFVPLAHAPAHTLFDAYYVRSLTPVLAFTALACLAWFGYAGQDPDASRTRRLLVAVGVTAVIASSGAFVYHAFYLNGHLATALYLLLVGAASLFVLRTGATGWLLVAGLAVPPLVLTRPEGAVVTAGLLVPVLADRDVPLRFRAGLYAVLAAATAGWFGAVVRPFGGGDVEQLGFAPDLALVVVAAAGLALLVPAVRRPRLGGVQVALLVLGGMVGALGLAVAAAPELMATSVRATLVNVARWHHWGATWFVALPLAAVLLLVARYRGWHLLAVPVFGALPVVLLLAFARQDPYRVAVADSGNRLLLHYLLVTGLHLALGIGVLARARARAEERHTVAAAEPAPDEAPHIP